MLEFNIDRVREWKGAPLVVMLLLSSCSEPVSKKWLERASGYTEKTIHQACEYLKERGHAVCTLDGWMLPNQAQPSKPDRKNSGPIIINVLDFKDLDSEVNNNTNSRKNSGLQPAGQLAQQASGAADTSKNAEMWQILAQACVHRNDRTRAMLKLGHVTPDYLRAKMGEYKSRGLGGNQWAGLFIRAVEAAEPAPPTGSNGHPGSCTCVECAVNTFFGH